MARPPVEVADVFRAHGAAWRKANAGHVSLGQLKGHRHVNEFGAAERLNGRHVDLP
jgi:hypothetical protein